MNLAQDETKWSASIVSWFYAFPSPSPLQLPPLSCRLQNSPFLVPAVENAVCTSLPVPASGFSSVTKISASVKCAACVKNRLNEVSLGRRRVSQLVSRFVISRPCAYLLCLLLLFTDAWHDEVALLSGCSLCSSATNVATLTFPMLCNKNLVLLDQWPPLEWQLLAFCDITKNVWYVVDFIELTERYKNQDKLCFLFVINFKSR